MEHCLACFSVSLKISSLDAEPGSEARELAGSIPRCRDGRGQLQHSQLLLDHLALLLSVFCSSHVHQQQFGTVSAPRGSQELSVVPPHLQHPRQVAALGREKWHSQIPGFLPGRAPFHWHEGTVPLTNIYFKMLLNKLALQSSPWLPSAWLPSNKHGGTKVVLTGFSLYILKDLVPLQQLVEKSTAIQCEEGWSGQPEMETGVSEKNTCTLSK